MVQGKGEGRDKQTLAGEDSPSKQYPSFWPSRLLDLQKPLTGTEPAKKKKKKGAG